MAEDEYKTSETLPQFASSELGKDFRVSLVFASEKNKNDLPGLEVLDEADVLLLSARRRPLPKAQLDRFRKFIAAKKPVVGIRTATHPFHLRNQKPPEGLEDWPTFDADVIGSNYSNHHGNNLKAWYWKLDGVSHPILEGLPEGEIPIEGSLYVVLPLAKNTTELMRGKAEGIAQQEPVTWTFQRPDGGKTVYTSLGHPTHFSLPAFVRLLSNAVYWAAGIEKTVGSAGVGACGGEETKTSSNDTPASSPPNPRTPAPPHWTSLPVPGTWDSHRDDLKSFDGIAWYRATVTPPASWKGRGLYLYVEKVDNACETYFNGVKIGVSGTFPPNYESGLASNEHRYVIPADAVKVGEPNVVAIRVYDHDGAGGFKGRAPHLLGGNEAITMEGPWQFRTGDDIAWALKSADDPTLAVFASFTKLVPTPKLSPFATVINRRPQDHPLSAEESLSRFKVPADLEVDLVLAEPIVSQPLFLNFDERGRMWVLQYLQYPEPAGLKLLSKDQWWRAVYDKVPLPPPHGVKGRDKITIHEDTDGDGTFDKHKTFVDGLNIATAFAQGRGGVFVLNPPYLLFYPDKNRDDVPDADPEVLLEGFGIEDTHSVVNSLRWGPDGWLYAAQGSTVSGNVKRPGEKTGIASQGQNIWRYHPEQKKYEIFSEGGGNAFGVEFDAAGRVFSGHNGGNTRGFHYLQGAYLQKGFNKHGALGNPYAFGYFPAMEHGNYARFTHQFVVYEGDALPSPYQGLIFGVNPINSHVVMSERIPVGSTFKTKDVGFAIESADSWFRPVDIKDGPDGNLYVADWYDGQLAHTANYQGGIDKDRGRIYRIRSRQPSPKRERQVPSTHDELVKTLAHPDRWHRQTALRLLADQPTPAPRNALHDQLAHSTGTLAVESLWALGVNHELSGGRVVTALVHPESQVRAWAWRLWFDQNDRLPQDLVAPFMVALEQEADIHVLCQIACSAKRISKADQALPIVRELMKRSQYIDDPRFPLLVWWALEAKVQPERAAVLAVLSDKDLWREPLVEKEILPRLMRRFAATGQRADLTVCAQLLQQSPSKEATAALMRGFEEAYQGRSLANVPPDLVQALSQAGGGSLTLKVRQGDAAAITEALKLLADEKASSGKRLEYAALFGEVKSPAALTVLLDVLGKTPDEGLKAAILGALPAYNDEQIPQTVLAQYSQYTDGVRSPAQALLASRKPWAMAFVQAVSRGDIPAKSIPLETVRQLTMHRDPQLATLVQQLWGTVEGASTAEMQAQLERFTAVLSAGEGGDPYPGKKLYMQSCGKCHKLHEQGGQIGPDLTTFKRDDVPRLLLNILNPSAEIREGFEMHIAVVDDGRVVQGFLIEQDPQVLVLRNTEGATITLERPSIEEHQILKKSLMPEGLLKDLGETDLRNLFAYLRSGQPLAD
jgi:putative membrane-bound dehydrogenase-like protein